MKTSEIPKSGIGPLQGVNVLLSGSATAGPYAATMMSDFGANVIDMESAIMPDTSRASNDVFEQDHRNQRGIAVNVPTPDGQEIFYKLIKNVDIFIESSKGGQWKKWGITDELMWKVNPALVIVHVSGFGQSGDPAYIKRASWDGVGLAFGTITDQNGFPEEPMPIGPYICDGLTAMSASWGALAAYYRAMQTGKGESIDVAQFEIMLRNQSGTPYKYFQQGIIPARTGNENSIAACFRNFKCSDGYIFIGFSGPGLIKNALAFFGFEYGTENFPSSFPWVSAGTKGAALITEAIEKFCQERTIDEVEQEMNKLGVPCSPIMDFAMAEKNSHYIAREVFTEWTHRDGRTVKGVNIIPKMKKNPGKIWKAAPGWGEDNEDVLSELGYSADDISALYDKKVLNKA
ncbi:MAG TPA: bile-acid-CoA hydrolase [Clostridiales bacterium]|nr:bile-acid-CoA hydrolase [Clostridiales bacterium]